MKEIKCGSVHKALSAIDETEEDAYLDLDYRLVDFFKGNGLVSAYSTWFYQEMLASDKKLERARMRLEAAKSEAASNEKSIKKLEQDLKSTWGYNSDYVQSMKEQLADRRRKRGEKLRAAESLEEKIDRLEAMPAPGDYRLTIDGNYVMLTEKGEAWLKCLSGRLDEFENSPMENFEREIDEFESKIDRYCTRSVEILELMASRGFGKHSQDVIDCAVRLATTEGTIQEAYNRMRNINDLLNNDSQFHTGLKHYARLIPSAAVAMQPENIGMLKEELIETYKELVKMKYYVNSFEWWLASAAMELNRFNIEKNIERYEEVLAALAKKGWANVSWDKKARHTQYMAANLARGMDSPEELTKQLRIQQQRLVSTGRTKGKDLDTSSLILLDSEASLEERTDRFVEAWEEMGNNAWARYTCFYPAAAALSVMPFSVEENVMWLGRIIRRLKEDGLENKNEKREGFKDGLTYKALDILMAAYRGQFRQKVMPHFIFHSSNSYLSDL